MMHSQPQLVLLMNPSAGVLHDSMTRSTSRDPPLAAVRVPLSRFTAEAKEVTMSEGANVTITTFTMISHGGKRSAHGEKVGGTNNHSRAAALSCRQQQIVSTLLCLGVDFGGCC
jgi:hypothetical protein